LALHFRAEFIEKVCKASSKQQAEQPEAGSWQPVASSMKQNSIFPYLRLSKINLFMNYLRQLIVVPILLLLNYSSFAQWTPLATGTNDNISCVRYACIWSSMGRNMEWCAPLL
jgi:hypothetical protein